ncbi:sensor histidine kinase [Neptunomonas antarctica]|uniref:histidine kinase n=1 Tax=Neptunomonas antarctica TaxID=619304 RepID=A0A1N7M7D2_9GAMM|nr:HAMP domain-containing sensor histidine kinase [Neptunomonas antarctica]SIS81933.1 two-component system, NtrC family, sensor histidine kinase GlrK [Neptunomonas antarctica]
MTRKAWQAMSLKQLVFIAFLLIITPIGYMLYKTSNVLERQLQQSYQQTQTALELSQQNNVLERLAEDIVRSATQYKILKSPPLIERLNEQIESFNNQLSIQMFLTEKSQYQQRFQRLFSEVQTDPFNEIINSLPQLTRDLAEQSHQQVALELTNLQEQARETRQALWWQTGLLVLTTLILMLFFSSLITRPIAELISRIKAIGRREKVPEEPIHGPMEIVQLNNQVLWLNKHLHQLEQLKDEFIQHISHELKTPLTTLREGADLLAEEVPGPLNTQQKRVVSLMQSSSISLQQLIEQLLDYNRLQQPNTIQLQRVDIQKAIAETITPLQLLISEKSIHLSLPDESFVVQLDPNMLHRILSNLISNAIYYTERDGHVIIATRVIKNCLVIDVENSGSAILPDDAGRIFEPFYQGKKRRSGPLKGTGIGLSIAMEASKAMHGKLVLITNKADKIVFRLTLPLEQL